MVSITPQQLLVARREELSLAIRTSLGKNLDGDAFALRVLGTDLISEIGGEPVSERQMTADEILYQGFHGVAYLGFILESNRDLMDKFTVGITRLAQRSDTSLTTFAADDVALLGVANGLRLLDQKTVVDYQQLITWLLHLIDRFLSPRQWSSRMRDLAGDWLDHRGRLRAEPDETDLDVLALEVALRNTWPEAFMATPTSNEAIYRNLLEHLLLQPPPTAGDLERSIVWLKALNSVVNYAAKSLYPTISDTSRLLEDIQHALKRWRWEKTSSRQKTVPSQWLIDNEYDVQALLWMVLYPIFGSDLVDETYLPNWGNVQPRVDLGITKLKLIIEVKIARQPADFTKIEEEVAGDLGLYFKDTSQFDQLTVFVYDDCNNPQPERYAALKNALKQRDHVEDVIIIRRPSMIPGRGSRTPPLPEESVHKDQQPTNEPLLSNALVEDAKDQSPAAS